MNESNIGICSWSIDRHDVLHAIDQTRRTLDLPIVQIGFFSASALQEADAGKIKQAAKNAEVKIAANFIAFEGEDYTTIATITETGGYMPDEPYQQRLELTEKASALTAELECKSLATHIGTIPADTDNPDHQKLVARVQEVADRINQHGTRLLIETGRESAATLTKFMESVDRPNIAINFDPANFIAFGADDPARTVTRLLPNIEAVHLKDAFQSISPGAEYGRYAALGTGDASVARVVNKLRLGGYRGSLFIERGGKAGEMDELKAAVDYVKSLIT